MIPWLVALPLLMALITLLLRKTPLIATPLAAATLVVMAILAMPGQEAEPFLILGRSLELPPLEGMLLAFCCIILALVTLYAYRIPQRPLAYPLTLGSVGFFAGALMIENLTIATLLLASGAILTAMLIPSARKGSARAGMCTIIAIVLATACLLLAALVAETEAADLDSGWLLMGSIALATGTAGALGLFPFVWLPGVARRGNSLAMLMVTVVFGAVVLLYLRDMLQGFSWPGEAELFPMLLLWSGLLTSLVGSLGAIVQRSARGFFAYAALADLGMMVVALAVGPVEGPGAGMLYVVYRAVAIVLVAMSVGILRFHLEGDDIEDLRGAFRCAPLAVIGLGIGGLSLIGLPPTVGFLSRLAVYRVLASEHLGWAIALMACAIGPAWAMGRCLFAALQARVPPHRRRGSRVPELLTLPLSFTLLALGLFPSLLTLLPEWTDLLASAQLILGG